MIGAGLSIWNHQSCHPPVWIPQRSKALAAKAAFILLDGEIGGSMYGTIYPTISGHQNGEIDRPSRWMINFSGRILEQLLSGRIIEQL